MAVPGLDPGIHPAIRRGTVPFEMPGTSPGVTVGAAQPGQTGNCQHLTSSAAAHRSMSN